MPDNYLHNVHIVLGIINNLQIKVHEGMQIGHKQRQWQFIESCAFFDLGICRMTWNQPFSDTGGYLWIEESMSNHVNSTNISLAQSKSVNQFLHVGELIFCWKEGTPESANHMLPQLTSLANGQGKVTFSKNGSNHWDPQHKPTIYCFYQCAENSLSNSLCLSKLMVGVGTWWFLAFITPEWQTWRASKMTFKPMGGWSVQTAQSISLF